MQLCFLVSTSCRLIASHHNVAFLLPSGIASTFTSLTFFRICMVIFGKRPDRAVVRSSTEKWVDVKRFLRKLVYPISFSALLGTSWLFGFILIIEPPIGIQYTFSILQMMTGVLIFLFHILGREEIRSEWRSSIASVTGSLSFSLHNLSEDLDRRGSREDSERKRAWKKNRLVALIISGIRRISWTYQKHCKDTQKECFVDISRQEQGSPE